MNIFDLALLGSIPVLAYFISKAILLWKSDYDKRSAMEKDDD